MSEFFTFLRRLPAIEQGAISLPDFRKTVQGPEESARLKKPYTL